MNSHFQAIQRHFTTKVSLDLFLYCHDFCDLKFEQILWILLRRENKGRTILLERVVENFVFRKFPTISTSRVRETFPATCRQSLGSGWKWNPHPWDSIKHTLRCFVHYNFQMKYLNKIKSLFFCSRELHNSCILIMILFSPRSAPSSRLFSMSSLSFS